MDLPRSDLCAVFGEWWFHAIRFPQESLLLHFLRLGDFSSQRRAVVYVYEGDDFTAVKYI
jgi:hypothetical protein